MPRKLLVTPRAVKRTRLIPLSLLTFCLLLGACGSAPPPPPERDPYGPRVARCIISTRTLSDTAQDAMIKVPGGLAVLGSTTQERSQARIDFGPGGQKHFRGEANRRRARVQGFRMDKHPVTNQAYSEFVSGCGNLPPDEELLTKSAWDDLRRTYALHFDYPVVRRHLWSGRDFPVNRERHPVVLVTQDDAAYYCAWRGGRLPTETEWERASRGVQGNIYPWGNAWDPFRSNTRTKKIMDTVEVGSFPKANSAEGFTDMGGHLWEWTSSKWPKGKQEWVIKGNGWDGRGGYGRGASRFRRDERVRDVTLGFRCAADGR